MKTHCNSSAPGPQAMPVAEFAPSLAELRRENLELRETNRMLCGLQTLATAAHGCLDMNRALHAAIEKVAQICRFDATRIYLCDEATRTVRLEASFDDDPARLAATPCSASGEGVVGWVTDTGQSLTFENIQSSPLYRRLSRTRVLKRFRYRFFAVFPIKNKGNTWGAIGCASKAPRRLSSSEVNFLEAVADLLGAAIENGGLYDRVRRRVQELELEKANLAEVVRNKEELLDLVSRATRVPIHALMRFMPRYEG